MKEDIKDIAYSFFFSIISILITITIALSFMFAILILSDIISFNEIESSIEYLILE